MTQSLYCWGKSPCCTLDKRLMGHKTIVDIVRNKNLCPCQESNTNSPGHSVHGIVITLTNLS
jgi:hypothetical protein